MNLDFAIFSYCWGKMCGVTAFGVCEGAGIQSDASSVFPWAFLAQLQQHYGDLWNLPELTAVGLGQPQLLLTEALLPVPGHGHPIPGVSTRLYRCWIPNISCQGISSDAVWCLSSICPLNLSNRWWQTSEQCVLMDSSLKQAVLNDSILTTLAGECCEAAGCQRPPRHLPGPGPL